MTGWLAGQKGTADRLNDNTPHTISYTSLTANTSAVTTTETVGLTTASVTFETGRAYRITLKCLVQSSVAADTVTVRVRKTNTSGTAYIDQVRVSIPAGGANAPVYFQNICTNSTSADVTAALVATYVRASGTGNALIAASTSNVTYVEVEDIGLAADFSGAMAIT
jgi:hypothetical protein